ncbi:MAG: FtsW/RodA/SpoVE family cell cycle protein [Planctomycetota bacterium]|nr:FtsW/RodA/SpoVE family cell cycle protein [Planctomycetota bacterium]
MFETAKEYLRYTNWPIILAMLALIGLGIVAIDTCEDYCPKLTDRALVARQISFAAVAVAVFVVMSALLYDRLGRVSYALLAGTIVVLVGVFALPADTQGTHRWIDLKVIKIQPSEFAKLTYVIALAWYLRYRDNYRRLSGLVVPFLVTMVPMALVFLEPDLGTSLLFLPTLYFMLFMAGAKLRHLLGIVVLGAVLLLLPTPRRLKPEMPAAEQTNRRLLAYKVFKVGDNEYAVSAVPLTVIGGYQVSRIVGWLWQDNDKLAQKEAYQLQMSKTLVGCGGWTGLTQGDDTFYYLLPDLPEGHTDFIFSVIGGRWGVLGGLGMLCLYGVIFLFGLEIATKTYDPFGRLLAIGVVAMVFSQLMINISMTIGLLPVTGMTLPLVSYGGSSLVVNCAALGLLINISRRRPMLLGAHPFEHERREKELPVTRALPGSEWPEDLGHDA